MREIKDELAWLMAEHCAKITKRYGFAPTRAQLEEYFPDIPGIKNRAFVIEQFEEFYAKYGEKVKALNSGN